MEGRIVAIRMVRPEDPSPRWGDLAVAAALAVAASLAVTSLPGGAWLRIAVVAPVLLVVPGYLLIQAFVLPAGSRRAMGLHLAASLGTTPAVLGLLALVVAAIPGGFRPEAIVTSVTLASLGLAAAAFSRRMVHATARRQEESPDRAPPSPGAQRLGLARPDLGRRE